MRHRVWALGLALGASAAASAGEARAGGPSTADCLSASDASLASETAHKLRAERAQLLVCAAPSCPGDIRKDCASRVADINAQIPTIIFSVKDDRGADLSAVKVTMDSEVLTERLDGSGIAIDPGEHTFVFETAGQSPVTRKFLVRQAQKDRQEVVSLGNPDGAAAAKPAAVQAITPPAAPAPQASQGLGTQKILALVAGGIGVVGVGVGSVFGLQAMSKKNDAQKACADTCNTTDGVTKWNDATSAGNVSTIGFILGGVGLAGAAVLWLTAPSAGGATSQVGLGPNGLLVRGSW